MTCTLIACLLAGALDSVQPPNVVFDGYLSAYAEAPTIGTIAYRQAVGDIPQDLRPYNVLIAVADCSLIGKEALLISGGNVYEALVFDCAGNDGTPSWMEQNNIVAEVDWYFWQLRPDLVGQAATVVVKAHTRNNNH